MKQNSIESVAMASKRNPNPLPKVDSRWIAHDRRGEIVVVDKVVFDQEMRENRIWYHEEKTGYRGSTWQSRFRQRKAFAAVSEPAPVVAVSEALPVSAAPSAPEHGPSCSECGAPCPKRKNGNWRSTCSEECMEKRRGHVPSGESPSCSECGAPCQKWQNGSNRWRSTCSEKCLSKRRARSGAAWMEKRTHPVRPGAVAKAKLDESRTRSASAPTTEHGPPCVECGAPCRRRKGTTGCEKWRSTCSARCLSSYRSKTMAKAETWRSSPVVGAKALPVPTSIDTVAEVKSIQLTLRFTPTEAAALERIVKKAAKPGLEVSTSQAARMAFVEGIKALDK